MFYLLKKLVISYLLAVSIIVISFHSYQMCFSSSQAPKTKAFIVSILLGHQIAMDYCTFVSNAMLILEQLNNNSRGSDNLEHYSDW